MTSFTANGDEGKPRTPDAADLVACLSPEVLTRFTSLACQLLGASIAGIAVIQQQGLRIQSSTGLSHAEMTKGMVFFESTLQASELLLVPDTQLDARFSLNVLVTDAPEVRFFLGVPLHMPSGLCVGALVIMDTKPRSLSDEQLAAMLNLAALLVQCAKNPLFTTTALHQQPAAIKEPIKGLERLTSYRAHAIVMTNRSGEIEWVNDGFTALTGFSLAEVLGKRPGAFLQGPDTDPLTVKAMQKAIQEGTGFHVRVINYTKSGSPYWIGISCSPTMDDEGVVDGFIALESDVTEELALRQQLQQQKNFFESIFQSNINAITVLDKHGKLIKVNRGAEAILGIEEHKLADGSIGYSDPVWQITDLRGLPIPAEQLPFSLLQAGKELVTDFRHNIVWPNGDFRSLSINGAVLPDTELSTPQYVFSIQDITEQLRLEQLKSEFVASVSHELRTPLTAIIGGIDLLQTVASALPERMQKLLRMSQLNAKRLHALINDLLDFEKLSVGKMDLRLEPMSLTALVQQSIESMRHYPAANQVQLSLQMASVEDVRVVVDERRFIQVLTNLLSNAMKFSPINGKVMIEAFPIQHNRVKLWVHDEGPGIPKKFHRRVFEKFAQADSCDTRQRGGTGLGLAITKQLIENMAGSIGFESEEGKGAHFWLELPTAENGP